MTQPPITTLGRGILHRAIVSVPDNMAEPGRGLQERVVFFEAPESDGACVHLETLLASTWCTDTANWCADGCIYNVHDVTALKNKSKGGLPHGELYLLEKGCGGDIGVGELRIHYARAEEVDLLVTPRVAGRLRELLDLVEHLYESEPAKHRGPNGKS